MKSPSSRDAEGDIAQLLRWVVTTHVKPHTIPLILAGLCMAANAAATGGIAWSVKPIMDAGTQGGDSATLYWAASALLLLMTVNGLAIYGRVVLLEIVGQQIVANLQVQIFRHYVISDLAFLNNHHSGQLLSRCLNDTSVVKDMISKSILSLVRDVLMFVVLVGVMLYRDWQLTLVTFAVLPIVGLGIGRIGKLASKASEAVLNETANVTTVVSEALNGARLIIAYGAEGREIARARKALDKRRMWQVSLTRTRALVSPMTEFLGGLAIFLTIIYGAWRVDQGNFSIGSLASYLSALALCYRPLKRLADFRVEIQQGLVAVRRVREVLDNSPTIVDPADPKPMGRPGGTIRFENVSFAYRPGEPIIHALDLTIPAGKRVALVGPSGAGKSTLINLIPRLYDVVSGRISIDGVDIRDVTLSSLRGAIALVTQEPIIFDDTIRANIAYGKHDASDEEIYAAARTANAEEFITNLPLGYDTVTGERGVQLSGGQRQRIAIARAILKDARILLLDEPTSSLDNKSEQSVKVALSRLVERRTTLIVAHRLATIMDADEIHVLDGGCIVESGRHAELLAQGGLYSRLYSLQMSEAASPVMPANPASIATGKARGSG